MDDGAFEQYKKDKRTKFHIYCDFDIINPLKSIESIKVFN